MTLPSTQEFPSPIDPEVVEYPFDYYHKLRSQDPVHQATGEDFYLVTRYDDVATVMKSPDRFSSRSGPGFRRPPSPEVQEVMTQGYRIVNTLLTNDPPQHTRYRSLVNTVFTPKKVSTLESGVYVIANELIDGFIDKGTVEFVSQFAVGVPMIVIATALGVPRGDMASFKRWSDDSMAQIGGMITPEQGVECARSVVELQRYFAAKLEERRSDPGDDLLSLLLAARVDGEEPLTTEEMLAIVHVLLVAGNETTTNLIASTMMLLVQHPDQLAKVLVDRSLIPNLIEESLRMEPPVLSNRRVVRIDTDINGCPVSEGAQIHVVVGSANHDEAVFDQPENFDVTRSNARSHLAFGQGVHYCLGSALARLEARVAFEVLLDRITNIRLAPGATLRHLPSMSVRALEQLDLEFDRL
jgi:cytochrome P450